MIQLEYIADRSSINYENFREGDVLSQDDSAPCIDDAYIFPAPSYQDLGNGFVKCTVTAYGRTTQQLTTVYSRRAAVVDFYQPREITENVDNVNLFVSAYAEPVPTNIIRDVAIVSSVIRKDDTLGLSFPVLGIYASSGAVIPTPVLVTTVFRTSGPMEPPIFNTYTATTFLEPFLESFSQIEYGEFIELVYTITVRTAGTLQFDGTAAESTGE
jgi:hypothetical protein